MLMSIIENLNIIQCSWMICSKYSYLLMSFLIMIRLYNNIHIYILHVYGIVALIKAWASKWLSTINKQMAGKIPSAEIYTIEVLTNSTWKACLTWIDVKRRIAKYTLLKLHSCSFCTRYFSNSKYLLQWRIRHS